MTRLLFIFFVMLTGCKSEEKKVEKTFFSAVGIEDVYRDSFSVRAIEVIGHNVAFAGSNGIYGLYNSAQNSVKVNEQKYDTLIPEFRAVASTSNDFFMLNVGNPALLFKTGDAGSMEVVYKEEHENVFYDSMAFWNEEEGIAMGDPVENCLSIIITRNGGHTWEKLSCNTLPQTVEGEAAFAASDSNIAIAGEKTWLISGGKASRVFYSPDKGKTWEVMILRSSRGRLPRELIR